MTTSEPPPQQPAGRRRARPAALVVEDFKSVRRWLVVLGALAVLASAVAIYAVVKSGESADEDRTDALEQRLNAIQLQAEGAEEESDVERLERRLRRAAEEGDVARLDRRLRRIERDVVDALDAAADTGRALDRLDDRMGRLERRR
jgi:hypothetical protein